MGLFLKKMGGDGPCPIHIATATFILSEFAFIFTTTTSEKAVPVVHCLLIQNWSVYESMVMHYKFRTLSSLVPSTLFSLDISTLSAKMGSGDWLKTVICVKKVKTSSSKHAKEKSNALKSNNLQEDSSKFKNGGTNGSSKSLGMPIKDVAAIRIQTAYRAYRAWKNLRLLKRAVRLQNLTQGHSVRKHATSTLGYLHSWSNIQAQFKARRLCMVTEGRPRQKRLENQRKLEAKLHDVEVEWCGGADAMEEILSRIHESEEAAVKRERAMAYAFSHQMIAMRYGSIPIVLKTGGLNDSVFVFDDETIPTELRNGYPFLTPDEQGLNNALERAFNHYFSNPGGWQQLVQKVMSIDFSWETSAAQYEELYSKSVARARAVAAGRS